MSQHHFKTEVSRLLELIIHSLYSHKEIFLRELVSNASDAIDKLKYLTLSNESYRGFGFEPAIRIIIDKSGKTLSITDNGIGMDEKELADNLGTIARSGTKAFLEKLPADAKKDSNLIGQFGVGFYSAFMVASKVEVTSRKAGTEEAFVWSSEGSGEYSIDKAIRAQHGTEVKLILNQEGEEYLQRWNVQSILKKYSNHIAYPICLVSEEDKHDKEGKVEGSEHKEEIVNVATALWRRQKSELTDQDYIDFYKSFSALSFDAEDEEPLVWMHTKAEGTIEYSTLFYIPSKAPYDLFRADYKPQVKLFVKRVFITDDDKELLPVYLRFVRGVIDSEDLPLNVSREILQQNRVMASIRQASVKKILTELGELATTNPARFGQFIDNFNRPLKEGLYSDYANREQLLGLVRFKSTLVDGWTSLADYKGRMQSDQKTIYYLTGGALEKLRKSPLLEMYNKKKLEVLLCTDEIDEIVMSALGEFDGVELMSVNRTGSEQAFADKAKDDTAEDADMITRAVAAARKALGDAVKDVKRSMRLDVSPSCVVLDESGMSYNLREMLQQMGSAAMPEVKPILELNPHHALVKRLANAEAQEAEDLAHILLGQALLVEGAPLADPVDFATRLSRVLVGS